MTRANQGKIRGCIGRIGQRLRRAPSDSTGAALVEFGMALPVFLIFVFGTIEFGRILWSKHALDYAAEQSTRYALANPDATTGEIQTYAEGQLMTVDKSAVTVSVVQENLNGIDYLSVTMAYPFQSLLPILPLGGFSLTGVSRIPLDS